ncbi:hypothetical protein BDZ45DRAFT_297532 [Acephala macrosclerotiorum]|nr:hypothetical protein BDZ45DRAFT_297532 [Acephala macrosclerotiorum]
MARRKNKSKLALHDQADNGGKLEAGPATALLEVQNTGLAEDKISTTQSPVPIFSSTLTRHPVSRKTARKTAKKLRDVNIIEAQAIIKSRLQRPDPLPYDPPTKFQRFTELPKELRLQIYDDLMPGPRMLEVLWTEKGDRYYSYRRAPLLLHIWSESRDYALKRYHLLTVDNGCGTITPAPTYNTQRAFGTYFDFERDGLYFSLGNSHRALRYLERVDDFLSKLEPLDAVSRLQHVMFDAEVMYARGVGFPSKFSELTSLRYLGMAVNDINLSFTNRSRKNAAPQFPMGDAMPRSLKDIVVRRWNWKQGRIETQCHQRGPFQAWNGPYHAGLFDGIKLDMKAQGLDEALVDRLRLCLLDIERKR